MNTEDVASLQLASSTTDDVCSSSVIIIRTDEAVIEPAGSLPILTMEKTVIVPAGSLPILTMEKTVIQPAGSLPIHHYGESSDPASRITPYSSLWGKQRSSQQDNSLFLTMGKQ